MASENFEKCLAFTLHYEGGFSNNPNDPGGRTQEGITQTTYSNWLAVKNRQNADVKGIPPADRDAIYRDEFWGRIKGDQLRPGEDLVVFDLAVNSGPARALKIWSEGGGSKATLEEIISQVSARRLSFLQGLRTWRFFGPGWSRRVQACHTAALAMARTPEPVPAPPVVPSQPQPAPRPPTPPQPMPGPVLPSTVGRQAAVLDQLLDIQGHYAAEISRLASEKAVIDNAISQLSGLAPPPAATPPPQLTDKSVPPQPPQPTERAHRMFGANWQTSAAGIGTLLASMGAIATALSEGKMPDPSVIAVILSSVTSGIGLLAAKDHNVTGGTVAQTPEAQIRMNRTH